MSRLRITEIFYSLQGETDRVGLPTVFIRLTGCPLRCQYCDTAYAFSGGKQWSLDDIIKEVKQYQTQYVTVTGGEPLAQPNSFTLLTRLADEGYDVSLETSGAMDIADVDSRTTIILDLKTPASAEQQRNLWSNLQHIKPRDQIKFVICDNDDYQWAKQQIVEHRLTEKATVLFSPSHQQLSATELADWILKDQLDVRLQLQLHKILWGDKPGV